MNKKQMLLFILWICLIVGLIAFAVVYIIIAEAKQVSANSSTNSLIVFQILKLFI